ncbi:MAG: primosomal protein N' (replication factor Y) - superfamily II helicase [Sulfurovum sp.]|nr:MAG: primosomal protein N' (replication factor Y) - superfamily II helicase [Sulfurovum sp.]
MKFSAINFTCPSCGAPQKFSPATGKLTCEFCRKEEFIPLSEKSIHEYNFNEAVSTLEAEQTRTIVKKVACKKCGAHFNLTPYSFSSNCPYCNTPAIIDFIQQITPKSLIPFHITQQKASAIFKKWIGSRWFAPNAFKKYFRGETKLAGYYLPHWTYDSNSVTSYHGLRGDIYYVTVRQTIMENGRPREILVQEPRIQWTPVSGTIYLSFDDITIGASQTISRVILNAIEPWDTSKLVPFDEKYLSGFQAEEYTIGLDNGFEFAKAKMAYHIENNIHYDIGGDQQQITSVQTQHHDITYKNVLLPVWTASFTWKNKTYSYAINAQTGKIVGDRPYSYVKIVLLVLTILSLISSIIYLDKKGTLQIFNPTYHKNVIIHSY